METGSAEKSVLDSNLPDCQSSNSDAFNMNSLKESIPADRQKKSSNKNDESLNVNDDEFFDAVDEHVSENEEDLDLEEEEIENLYKDSSEEELQKWKNEASVLKNAGNESFKASNHTEAVTLYTKALNICPLKYQNDRSILYANRAAARIGLEKKEEALLDCNKAIELNPDYLRAVLRRAQLHKKMDRLEKCLEDYKKVLELDKNNMEARQACATLPAEINERNEKLKEEMFGKLKELGNVCLKPFGLSTENFKMVQNETGGYSINFQK